MLNELFSQILVLCAPHDNLWILSRPYLVLLINTNQRVSSCFLKVLFVYGSLLPWRGWIWGPGVGNCCIFGMIEASLLADQRSVNIRFCISFCCHKNVANVAINQIDANMVFFFLFLFRLSKSDHFPVTLLFWLWGLHSVVSIPGLLPACVGANNGVASWQQRATGLMVRCLAVWDYHVGVVAGRRSQHYAVSQPMLTGNWGTWPMGHPPSFHGRKNATCVDWCLNSPPYRSPHLRLCKRLWKY